MSTAGRTLLVSCCAALMAMACGGGPTAPSSNGGTTIAGTVSVNGGAATLPGGSASSLTVTIVGTNMTAQVSSSGYFQFTNVPSGRVRLQFKDAVVDATAEVSNVGNEPFIEITVEIRGNTATIVNEVRADASVTLCHKEGNGSFHKITVNVSAEPAHRDHGDAKPGEKVPGTQNQTFDDNCGIVGPAVRIEKSTNGEDADEAPGPRVLVGTNVSWEYVVTNTGTVTLNNIVVTDDRNVTVTCPTNTLTPGQSMTCTGSGQATQGQYRNVGTVNASSASGNVSDTDASHYFGYLQEEEQGGEKVSMCHRTGAGFFVLITVDKSAEPAHLAHGDGYPGQGAFTASCSTR